MTDEQDFKKEVFKMVKRSHDQSHIIQILTTLLQTMTAMRIAENDGVISDKEAYAVCLAMEVMASDRVERHDEAFRESLREVLGPDGCRSESNELDANLAYVDRLGAARQVDEDKKLELVTFAGLVMNKIAANVNMPDDVETPYLDAMRTMFSQDDEETARRTRETLKGFGVDVDDDEFEIRRMGRGGPERLEEAMRVLKQKIETGELEVEPDEDGVGPLMLLDMRNAGLTEDDEPSAEHLDEVAEYVAKAVSMAPIEREHIRLMVTPEEGPLEVEAFFDQYLKRAFMPYEDVDPASVTRPGKA